MSRSIFNFLAAVLIFSLFAGCVFKSGDSKQTVPAANTNAVPAAKTPAAGNSPAAVEDKGDFIVERNELKNRKFFEIDRKLKNDKTLEKAADKLNRTLMLPNDIFLRTEDCHEANATFDPNDNSVTVCYELMEHFYNLFRGAGDADEKASAKMFDAIRFAFLHEIAHALIYSYKLPVTGSEEEAADRCSSFINIEELGEEGVRAVEAAAQAFRIESKQKKDRPASDEHLLEEQRYFNSVCMLYGSDAVRFGYLEREGYLPKERAERCPAEYEKTVDSWIRLLAPWRKK